MASQPHSPPCHELELHFPECNVWRDGPALHREIPRERWCVKKADLENLRCRLRAIVEQSLVSPTDQDPFDPADKYLGPKIYTVNQQVIKPVTARAGNVSWALMLHPEGQLCDVFVTHCWKEGGFEFLDKVLNSWPRKARAAYCCMLSNPQNLDIGALLGSPRDSPFAHALLAAKYLVVVPNRECSPYSRIWCVYEAFLGYEQEKIIMTATAPVAGVAVRVAALFLLSLATSVLFVLLFDQLLPNTLHEEQLAFTLAVATTAVAFSLCLFVGVIVPASAFIFACLSAGFAGVSMGVHIVMLRDASSYLLRTTPFTKVVDALLSLALCAAAAMGEAVRLWRLQSEKEGQQLLHGYTGLCRDAKASRPCDKEQILEDINKSSHEDAVNETIRVLLDQGMSSPTLREARARVGRLRQTGYRSLVMVILSTSMFLFLYTRHVGQAIEVNRLTHSSGDCALWNCTEDTSVARPAGQHELCLLCRSPFSRPQIRLSIVGFTWTVFWVLVFSFLPRDKQGFAMAALVRIALAIGGTALFAGSLVRQVAPGEDIFSSCLMNAVLEPLVVLLSLAGPGHTARIPRLGPFLVRYLMQPLPAIPLCLPSCRTSSS